jgi:signal peptidase II
LHKFIEDTTLGRNYKKDIIFLLALTLMFVFMDQITKYYIVNNVSANEPIVILENFSQITYVLNRGAAFGFLSDKAEKIRHPFFVTISFIAIALIIYIFFTLKKEDVLAGYSLCLILSGAIGNLIDRIRIRAVVDFIDIHYYNYHWPAFNIADALITVGVFLMAIDVIKKHRAEKEGA